MRATKIVALSIVAGSLIFAQGVLAKGMQNAPTFESFDINKDGKVTEAEFEQIRTKRMADKANEGKILKNAANAPQFSALDINKDGFLDSNEFATHQQQDRQKKMNSQGQGKGQKGKGIKKGKGQGKGGKKG